MIFGYGNWKDIAKYIGNKTEYDVEIHFKSFYENFKIKMGKEKNNI